MPEQSYDTQANDREEQAAVDVHPGEMNAYELRQEARRERLAVAAAKRRDEAQALLGSARTMADVIPFGQPILVGHHSEGHDRRFRARIDGKFRKGIALHKKAEELEKRAQTAAMETIVGDGWTISEDAEENRIVIRFDAKPPREMLDALRAGGFKWSPTRGAHVRMRSNGALYAAKRALGVNA